MKVSSLLDFLSTGIWQIQLAELPRKKALLIKTGRVILLALQGFFKHRCQKTAAVLTYYSLLNIVPIVAVAFAISKGFGLEKLIERQILQISEQANLQPELTQQILTFSHRLLDQAKGGVIAGVGVVLLFWTVVSILGKIEESLNEIWGVKQGRSLVRKFSDYISIMVFAPVLLIISSSATVLIASQIKLIMKKIALLGIFSPVILFLLNLLPYISIWVLLTLVYLLLPNTRIPLRSAILGGIVAGTIAQIVQWVYIKFQIGAANYGAIYGSFAALPLFLAMLQMSWMIVLFGAEMSCASGHVETYGFHPDPSRLSFASRRLLAFRVFHLLAQRFSRGESPLTAKEISDRLRIPVRLTHQLLEEWMEVGLVAETTGGPKHQSAYQPGRAIETLTVKEVLEAYERRGLSLDGVSSSGEERFLLDDLKHLSEVLRKGPPDLLVREMVIPS
ncbi:MAG: YihY/virulence factor BrkB family protein [Desulfobacterota bacterium]|nr:YihY/virulence factor BrkB family protein [Thermodesulfobacteriota bacterium]